MRLFARRKPADAVPRGALRSMPALAVYEAFRFYFVMRGTRAVFVRIPAAVWKAVDDAR